MNRANFLIILICSSNFLNAEIITEKEAFSADAGVYWHITKEISVKENKKVSLLFEFTNRGFGSLKLSHGVWLHIYDCSTNGGFLYAPCMMSQEIKDLNGDGYKDIYLETELVEPGETEKEQPKKLGKGFVELIYDPEANEFKFGKHSQKINTYTYYEE